jgi:hypothetical protein
LNPYGFASKHWSAVAGHARSLTGPARWSAYAQLALGIERAVTPWAVYEQTGQPAFFSARLGCIHYPPPLGGIDIAALCLRG